MFSRKSDSDYREMLDGIRMRTRVHGEKTLMSEFVLQKGAVLPEHDHPNEQTGYLVSGRLQLRIGDQTYETEPGDSWCIPANVTHSAVALADTVAIEIFAPVREDYLP